LQAPARGLRCGHGQWRGLCDGPPGQLFNSLYLLVIIVATILFSRGCVLLAGFVCIAGGLTLLVISGNAASSIRLHRHGIRIWFLSNHWDCGCGILGTSSQSLRKKELNSRKAQELLDLQDFSEDIIHSMRGGSLTTDVDGGYAAEPHGGRDPWQRFAEVRGLKLQDWNEDLLPANNGLKNRATPRN